MSNMAKEWCATAASGSAASSNAKVFLMSKVSSRSQVAIVLAQVFFEAAARRHRRVGTADGVRLLESLRVRQRGFDFQARRADAADAFHRRQLVGIGNAIAVDGAGADVVGFHHQSVTFPVA